MAPTQSKPRYRTRLDEIMATEGRKQTWLARQVGCSRAQISLIVGGYHADDATRRAIAEALGRTVDDVFPEAG